MASLPVQDCPDKPQSRSSAPVNKAINPPTLASFYNSQAMARYFAQAQRKDADATKPPGPGYVGAINDEYLKHKITEMMKAFERMTKKVFGQNVVQLTSLKK